MNGAHPNHPPSSTHGAQPAAPARPAPVPHAGPTKTPPPVSTPGEGVELDPIELVDELVEETAPSERKIQYLGVVDTGHRAQKWKRTPSVTGTGASRVRSFHGKYSEQGLEYLDNAINEWLDNHPEVEVKFVSSTVMTFEGKIREPALVLNLWY